MLNEPRIFVTGMGVVSPIGIGLADFWSSLVAGISGISLDPRLAELDVPWKFSARVDDFDGKRFVKPRKALKVMCREIQFGYVAATCALEQASGQQLPEHCFEPDRLACVFGAETFQGEPEELISAIQATQALNSQDLSSWGAVAMTQIQPLWMLKYLPNMAASHISIAVDARGPNNTICQGDVSSALALIEGADVLRRGWADCAIVGGTSSRVSPVGMIYRGAENLVAESASPQKALQPFAMPARGTVHGEGAASLILETEQSVLARGATPTVELVGWSRGFSRFNSNEFPKAIVEISKDALQQANLSAHDLGHINAHGSGSPQEDLYEATALAKIAPKIPLVAFKRNFGQTGPGASMLEIVASILALEHGNLPVTTNLAAEEVLFQLPLNRSSQTAAGTSFLKIAFAATGQITALVFRSIGTKS
ncbi:MAG: beta-ketoacyl synthase N-terminal-like domain-containing protein [Pirellulaceae bacterium]